MDRWTASGGTGGRENAATHFASKLPETCLSENHHAHPCPLLGSEWEVCYPPPLCPCALPRSLSKAPAMNGGHRYADETDHAIH